jgi:tetratricopeptide (TPR) repeat protein
MAKRKRPATGTDGAQKKLSPAQLRDLQSFLAGPEPFLDAPVFEEPVELPRPRGERRAKAQSVREQAEELLDQAVDGPIHGEALVRQALEVDPNCYEAWRMLAQIAETADEALRRYDEAIAAARRELGEHPFRDDVGHFWGIWATRPYMEALCDKAVCLLNLGRLSEAAVEFREMLRLNPNDNQGMRELLAKCYLELRQHDELQELFARYPDDGLMGMVVSEALLAFRLEGPSERANRRLAIALRRNRHVKAYLLGDKTPPPNLPGMVLVGGEEEAASCALSLQKSWQDTPGALEWLRQPKAKTAPSQEATASPLQLDLQKIDDAVLALLSLGLHEDNRAWKGFDWDALGRLYEQGFIHEPRGKARSVAFTAEGLKRSAELLAKLFGK